MRRKISLATKELIGVLHEKGLGTSEIANESGVSKSTVLMYVKAKINGLNTPGEYNNLWAQQRGYSSYYDLQKERLQKKGYVSYRDYVKDLTKQNRGLDSVVEYDAILARKRQKRPENKAIRKLIIKKLKETGENQSWLARQIGVTRQAVSLYVQRKAIPDDANMEKLFTILNVPYKTIDDLLNK